ncbi:MAG: hypothetical protein AAGJ38_01025 [Planctomycetota bacterium]
MLKAKPQESSVDDDLISAIRSFGVHRDDVRGSDRTLAEVVARAGFTAKGGQFFNRFGGRVSREEIGKKLRVETNYVNERLAKHTRSMMTTAEKAAYIGEYGSEAFLRLPD